MAKKKLAPLAKRITARISDKEAEALEAYCQEHEITGSDYIRSLVRIHLGFADDLKVLYTVHPRPKKEA